MTDGSLHDERRSKVNSTLGYNAVGGGGISNQKMALLGLFIIAYETKAAISLPYIRVMDQVNKIYDAIPIAQVFDEIRIREFAARWAIDVVDCAPEDLPHGYDRFFWRTVDVFENMPFSSRNETLSDLALDFLGSLRSRVGDSQLFRQLRKLVFHDREVLIAAQFRIERDWERHVVDNLRVKNLGPEDFLLSYDAIVGKIVSTFPDLKSIYFICDEPACDVSKDVMRNVVHDRFGVDLIWKSDFLGDFDRNLLTPLHLSLLDFEMGMDALCFVGLSRSTFSNMITLQKHSILQQHIMAHFIYNKASPEIARRTDNGCCFDPTRATLAR
jgi:hypothetical protein